MFDIQPDEHDKPRINKNAYYFSISHSWPYVAAVVSASHECGIDIQTWHPRMQKLQHKFLSPAEQLLFKDDTRLLTMAWCAKEAAYKWQGRRGVDFINHLPIISLKSNDQNYNIKINLELSVPNQILEVESLMEAAFSCVFVIGSNFVFQ